MTEPITPSPEPAAAALPGAPAGTWALDPERSTVTFTHKTMWGLVTVRGRFTDVRGDGEIAADGSVHGKLQISAASVDTKNKKRDDHLRSPDFFAAAEHPDIVVTVSQLDRRPGGALGVAGEVTVRGVSKPLDLTARANEVTADMVRLVAELVVDRADFGMTWNQMGMLKGAATVRADLCFTTG